MSSSPIERREDGLELFSDQAARRALGLDSHRRWFKRILPRSLYGRSLLIVILPLVLAQSIATWIFYDRHWETVARHLSTSVAADIALTLDSLSIADNEQERQLIFQRAAAETQLIYVLQRGQTLTTSLRPATGTRMEATLAHAIAERVGLPFQLGDEFHGQAILVSIQTSDGVMQVTVPRDRLFTPTTYIFIMWMVGSSLVLFAIALVFMRNQIKSLKRLAVAVDDFGKGRDVPSFKVEGATEVRQTGMAFLRMRDRIQRAITQRTEMLAGVSHDLRTPLTRMRLALELQKDDPRTAELKADVAAMERMIQGYIDFARGEGNEQTRPADLVALVRALAAGLGQAGAPVMMALPEECVLPLRPDAMHRCFGNLIANARRYGKHVWVTVVEGKTLVEVLIDDDGPGIPPADRENVFRPFFRLDPSRNPATGGTGLGLAIARDVARAHGGEIVLEDSPHGGLRARIRLPK
ncbi:MAG: two-component sensor histidine kinase [Alphaproteobacteria bacterium]|nr:two-component sensor histidine kinase [Alphaproteobacteria bacterium]